jgi:hypothetical protein
MDMGMEMDIDMETWKRILTYVAMVVDTDMDMNMDIDIAWTVDIDIPVLKRETD